MTRVCVWHTLVSSSKTFPKINGWGLLYIGGYDIIYYD